MRSLQGWASRVGAQQFEFDWASMVWRPRVGTQSLRAGRRKCLSFWVGLLFDHQFMCAVFNLQGSASGVGAQQLEFARLV